MSAVFHWLTAMVLCVPCVAKDANFSRIDLGPMYSPRLLVILPKFWVLLKSTPTDYPN